MTPRRLLNPGRLILRLFHLGGFSGQEASSVCPFLRTDFLKHIFFTINSSRDRKCLGDNGRNVQSKFLCTYPRKL